MRLLLDTHYYLWWIADHARLNQEARERIRSADEVYVSSASIWEATIKIGLGKLKVDVQALANAIEAFHFRPLPIHIQHAISVTTLPHHHHDPFDRMLLAQAKVEGLQLLTNDTAMRRYAPEIAVLWT